MTPLKRAISIASAIASCAFVAALCVRATLHPRGFEDLIEASTYSLLLVEFLTIHSSIILLSFAEARSDQPRQGPGRAMKAIVLGIYALAALAIAVRNWVPGVYFVVGLFGRTSAAKTALSAQRVAMVMAPGVLLIATVGVVASNAAWIAEMFPLPETYVLENDPNHTGLFVDYPQLGVVWGALYFSLRVVADTVIFALAPSRRPEPAT